MPAKIKIKPLDAFISCLALRAFLEAIEHQLQPYFYQLLLKWLREAEMGNSAETIAVATSWAIFEAIVLYL